MQLIHFNYGLWLELNIKKAKFCQKPQRVESKIKKRLVPELPTCREEVEGSMQLRTHAEAQENKPVQQVHS